MKIKLNKDVEKIFKRKEENKEEEKFLELNFKNVSFALLVFSMLSVTVFSLFLTFKTYKNMGKEEYVEYVEEASTKTVETEEDKEKKIAEEEEKQRLAEEARIKQKEEEKIKQKELEEIKRKEKIAKEKAQELNFTLPLTGEIIKKYSVNNVVYYETLDVWKIHEGIDIKAEEGASISVIESGKVISTKKDPLYGQIIVVEHGQGYKSIYCNLQNEILVKEGEVVKKGKVIAKVGSTAICEKKEGPHLHFEVTKDSKYIDPNTILNFKNI